jgi:phenylacetate-CoA ligase
VRLVAAHRATVLWGVTSYVRRVLRRAAELGANLESVRMCAVTGEASSPAMREELRGAMRALGTAGTTVLDRYGSTELGGLAQCCEGGDWHNPAPEIQYHEVVDPDTGRRLPDGERGALALTHLDRRGTVLVRFLVGDTVALARTPCPVCGRTGDRIVGPVERTRDLVKIKGMLVNPAALLETLGGMPAVDEFQVAVRKECPSDPFSMDEMVVRIATGIAAGDVGRDALCRDVVERAQRAARIRPRVEFVAAREIFDPAHQTKARRFVDER